MSDATVTAAPAADLDDAQALAAFAEFADAKTTGDPAPVEVPEPAETPATPEPAEPTAAAPAAATPAPEPAPAAAAPAAAATDIWSSATPELRAAHEAELALRDQKYRSDIGRQAAYQKKIADLEAALAQGTATPAAATPAAAAATPTSLREKPAIKKSLEDYPDVVTPLVEEIETVLADNARMGRELSVVTEDRRARAISAQEQALTAAHPDWQAACASKDFAAWLDTQPEAIKQIVVRNGDQVVDAAEAIAMVGSFKAHWALTHPRTPQPATPAPAAPTPLDTRRAAQLAAVTSTPKGAPAALPDGPAGGGDQAVFNHFVARKAAKG